MINHNPFQALKGTLLKSYVSNSFFELIKGIKKDGFRERLHDLCDLLCHASADSRAALDEYRERQGDDFEVY